MIEMRPVSYHLLLNNTPEILEVMRLNILELEARIIKLERRPKA